MYRYRVIIFNSSTGKEDEHQNTAMGKFKVLAALLFVVALGEVQGDLIESRMLGSRDTEKHSHQYHVALYRKWRLWPEEFAGSGALIAVRWILTSARVANNVDPIFLLKGGKAKAGLGRLDDKPVQVVDVEKIILHESYNSDRQADNDIAVVKLQNPGFIENDHVKFISLSREGPKGPVVVTDWHAAGKEKVPLQEISLDLKDKVSCKQELRVIEPITFDETVFCVENTKTHAVCENDQGAIAISVNGDQKHLTGIFSWTPQPEDGFVNGTLPAVFTNITFYHSWIENATLYYS